MRRWQRRWIFRSGSEKTSFWEQKRLALLDNKRWKIKKNLFENNRSICNFAALGRWSTAQWTPSVRCWPDLVSPQNRWLFLRTKCIYWEQSVFPENKLLFLTTKCFSSRTKCFSSRTKSFPENKVLFLENKVFSWEQSISPENKVLLIDQGLTKTCSPGEALPRHQTSWEEQSGCSELQEEEARHNRGTAKPSWTGGRPGSWHRFQTLFRFQTLSGSKLRIIAITYTGQPEPFSVHFKAKGKCICTDK